MQKAELRILLAILIAVTALGPLALNVLIPSMPGMVRAFDTSYAAVQLTLTLYLIGIASGQLVYGPLSDRFGRRPMLLTGLVMFIIGTAIAATASSIEVLILGRIIQAFGGCAGMVLGRAIVRDLFSRDRSASVIAYITMAMVLAPMVAPAIGGYLDEWFSWRAGFYLVGLIALPVLAVAIVKLQETNTSPRPLPGLDGMLSSYAYLLRQRAFLSYAVNMAFTTGIFFTFLGGGPYIVIEIMGLAPSTYGLMFVMVSIGYMLGNFTAGRISQRVGVDRMILTGSSISFVGSLVLIVFGLAGWITPFSLFIPMTVIAMANGLSLPNAMAGSVSVDPSFAGTASGLSGFLQMGAGATGTVIVGLFQGDSALPMILIMGASAAIALFGYLTLHDGRTMHPPQSASPDHAAEDRARG